MNNKKNIVTYLIIIFLFLGSSYRLISYYFEFSSDSLQMDFTAYYTAGKTLNHSLNPYKNYIESNLSLWDGYSQFKHSRFLYPPLVAVLFQPIALLPYIHAKYIWNLFNIILYIISVIILIRQLQITNFKKILFFFILSFNFFPFIALLERGQIDGITLFFLLIGFSLIYKHDNKDFLAGFLFGIAVVFKLYSILLIPFFLLIKRFKIVYGFISGILLIIFFTLLLYGFEPSKDYMLNEFLRIAKYGSSGTDQMRIPVWILQAYFPMTPTSISIIENRMYLTESISFNSKASLIRFIDVVQSKFNIEIPLIFYSVIIYIIFFSFIYKLFKKGFINVNIITFQLILLVITLSSPYTWVMNLVWMLPLSVILIYNYNILKCQKLAFLSLLIGYLLISLPDNLLITKGIPFLGELIKARFVIGQLICAFSLYIIIKKRIDLTL